MNASAIHEPMIPMGWIGGDPIDREVAWRPGAVVPADWHDLVVDHQLVCGIRVTAQRRGFTIYDFEGWTPGHPVSRRTQTSVDAGNRPTPRFRTFGEISKAAKPALVQRLRVINTHLTLLHAVRMASAGESPTVARVNERDLFRHDIDDHGNDVWYQPLGAGITDVVTPMDRHRYGAMPQGDFMAALDMVDQVIAAAALVEFDLLNQTQTAVTTHDYPLAVVAGWTVCELRTRELARGLSGVGPNTKAGAVSAALKHASRLPALLVSRLDAVRSRRNKWLHSGTEPSESEAIEAMHVAAELLRPIVGSLTLRPTSNLLML